MKATKLIEQLQKAIEKYGDINISAYSHSYAFDVEKESDAHSIKFRILNGDSDELPGIPMDEEDVQQPSPDSFFGIIFYND
jgi:hypothetical protein